MPRLLVKKIQEDSKNYHSKEDDKRRRVYYPGVDIFSTDLICVIFYKGVGKICFAKFFFYFPLPVCNGTIAPAKPDTQDKPGKSSGCNGHQMCFSCFWPYPTKKIKTDEDKVRKREKYVEEF